MHLNLVTPPLPLPKKREDKRKMPFDNRDGNSGVITVIVLVVGNGQVRLWLVHFIVNKVVDLSIK